MLGRLAVAAAGLLLLGGCVAAAGMGSGAGGFAAGYFASPSNDLALFNEALKLDAPVKALWCVDHASVIGPAVRAYCEHIPVSAAEVPATFVYMIEAGDRQ